MTCSFLPGTFTLLQCSVVLGNTDDIWCFLLPAARSLALSPWESSIVDRLMTPTLSFLARSRSAASVLSNGKDGRKLRLFNHVETQMSRSLKVWISFPDSHLCPRSASASPLTLCAHQPHRRCSDHWRVTSSTPDITQRQLRRSSTPVCFPELVHEKPSPTSYTMFCNQNIWVSFCPLP